MGQICTKHISVLLSKMIEKMFFIDSQHVGMGAMLPKKVVCLFMLYSWFLKITRL